MAGMRAMVLAAGVGERMRPLTEWLPKPLLPIANRPVMGYVLQHLARHGFTEVIANLHYQGERIVDCFAEGAAWGVNLTYTYEEKLWGIAGGVRRCKDFFGDDTFLVIGADDLTDIDLTALLAAHRQAGAIATIGLVEVQDTSQFGIVVTKEDGRIARFVEKPKHDPPSRTANTQIYLFEPEVFDFIPPDRVYDFGFDAFPAMVDAGAPFYGFKIPGYWRDIGSFADFLAAQCDVMEERVKVDVPGQKLAPGIWVDEGCVIHPEATLRATLALGKGCRVGRKACLGGGTAIGEGVRVPAASSLEKTVVLPGAKLPRAAKISHAVVAPAGIWTG